MDSFIRAQRNAFVTHAVDRVHSRRWDEAWLQQRLADPATRFIVVWQEQILVQDDAMEHLLSLDADAVQRLREACPEAPVDVILLGAVDDVTYFAIGVGDSCRISGWGAKPAGHFLDLRGAALSLEPEDGALAAQAKAMVHWHREHRYCSRCGSPTQSEEAGHLRRCMNETCAKVHFPRVDPAIIVLVVSGERCLLGRQPHWPENRYSNIAGFVEPGESLETAVAREIWEEAGIEIDSLEYHSSQPWPFPQSLMVGFTARAASTRITLNDHELQDARWFSRSDIRDGLLAGRLGLPSPYSISFHLIEDWFDEGAAGRLKAVLEEAGIVGG
ncbi:MAG: NAD(+) diphosphatase [Anaerolineae bacterium]